ncbi:MAG: hypothetical protein HQL55_18760 [Magnetococcales bacterium]|nr:hypothetical protein [Magnetococcales bacterium]
MINLKRTIHVQQRDHSQYCQHHCALCKNPCEKQGRYPSLPGSHPPVPIAVVPLIPEKKPLSDDG